MPDIHNRKNQLDNIRANIEASEEISEDNKESPEDVYFWLKRQKPKTGTGDRLQALVVPLSFCVLSRRQTQDL